MEPPRPPHHEEPCGQGHEPDDAHPDADADADQITVAQRLVACCRTVGCRASAPGSRAARLFSEDPAIYMDGEQACAGVSRRSGGHPRLRVAVVVVVCDSSARTDNAVALGRVSPSSPVCECVLPEIMECQSPGRIQRVSLIVTR